MTAKRLKQPSNITKCEAAKFDRDLEALIERARNGKDLRWTPVCVCLLDAQKYLVLMMAPKDVKEMA